MATTTTTTTPNRYVGSEVGIDNLLSEYRDWAGGTYAAGTRYNFENTDEYSWDATHLFSHENFESSVVGYAYVFVLVAAVTVAASMCWRVVGSRYPGPYAELARLSKQ
jgi:hypothetical protein